MIATIGLAMGRYHLKVGGVVVAVEADPCRDPRFPHANWNEKNLNEAAKIINDGLAPVRDEDPADYLRRLWPIDPRD